VIIYVIGSLRNPEVPKVSQALRERGYEVFDDWHAGGEKADDEWMKYEQARGRTYHEALAGYAARHTFEYDKFHLDRADVALMVAPAGKSGHLELGYLLGQGKPGFIYMPQEPERWDVMVLFATGVLKTLDELYECIERESFAKCVKYNARG
jgi:nucleoside 2-deoxyribosyltransferase